MNRAISAGVCLLAICNPCLAQESGTAPGGAYIGYYQEDPQTNPEDPVPGSIYLQLPAADGNFSGEMFFTYIGCQTSNVGNVSGTKSGTSLTGVWSGTVDGAAQTGTFAGSYGATTRHYTGTFTNAGGKQHRDLQPCIEYYIAPNGTWTLFPIEQSVPADFEVSVSANTARWRRPAGVAAYLVTLFDAAMLASSQGNAIVWQSILDAGTTTAHLPGARVQNGREYVVSVAALGQTARHVAFGSRRFAAQP
ncbi:MAG TPA: hypothetical protein VIT67_02030 [Povalibacter sp.]